MNTQQSRAQLILLIAAQVRELDDNGLIELCDKLVTGEFPVTSADINQSLEAPHGRRMLGALLVVTMTSNYDAPPMMGL